MEPGHELRALCEYWQGTPAFTQCAQLVSRLHTSAYPG